MLQDLPAGTITEIREHPTLSGWFLIKADWKETPIGWTLVGGGYEWDVVEEKDGWTVLQPARKACRLARWDKLYYFW